MNRRPSKFRCFTLDVLIWSDLYQNQNDLILDDKACPMPHLCSIVIGGIPKTQIQNLMLACFRGHCSPHSHLGLVIWVSDKAWPIANRAIGDLRGDLYFAIGRWSPIFTSKNDRKVIAIAKFDDRDLAIARSLVRTILKTNSFQKNEFLCFSCLQN